MKEALRAGFTQARKFIWKKPIECAKLMPPLRKSLLTQGQDSCKKTELLKPFEAFMLAFLRNVLRGRI